MKAVIAAAIAPKAPRAPKMMPVISPVPNDLLLLGFSDGVGDELEIITGGGVRTGLVLGPGLSMMPQESPRCAVFTASFSATVPRLS